MNKSYEEVLKEYMKTKKYNWFDDTEEGRESFYQLYISAKKGA